MAVKLRLRRTGKRNAPAHRLVAMEGSRARDGRFIETLGYYDPRRDAEEVKIERVDYWLSQGAQPTETVARIIERVRAKVSEQQQTPASDQQEAGDTDSETVPAADAGER